MTPVDLRDDGILWMINRSIFHPRGYALAIDENGNFYIRGDGRETWKFTDETDQGCFEKFSKLMDGLKS